MSDDSFGTFEGERKGGGPGDHDRVFDALSNHRRRIVLRHLADVEVASVEELASVLAAHRGDDRAEAMVALRHGDLPRLRDASLLEYDPRSGTARYDADALVETLLAIVAADDRGT